MTKTEDNTHCCPMCVADTTDTKSLQQQDRFCTRIAKMMEDPKSRFNERDSYCYDSTGLLYHINKENGKELKATIAPEVIKTVLQEMHDHFGTGKTHSLIKRYCYWPKMINTYRPMLTAALYVEDKRYKLINTNFRQLRYLKEHLLKCPLTSLLKCLLHIMAIKIS